MKAWCELVSVICRVARVWGKAIVTDKWLQASVVSGHCKDTAEYDLQPAVELPQSRSARTKDAFHLHQASLASS